MTPPPYRVGTEPASNAVPLLVATRPVSRFLFVTLVFCAAAAVAVGAMVGDGTPVVAGTAIFGLPAALLLALRLRTRVYDDCIVQGRIVASRLALSEVRHVFHRHVGVDPMRAVTAVSAAQLDEVVLVGVTGARASLSPVDIPREVLGGVVARALEAAVTAAEKSIEAGGAYRDPDRMSGLDAGNLHGYVVGLTLKRVSLPLADVVRVDAQGVVELRDRAGRLSVGPLDLVLRELLRRRGLA
jgi:hypothetical protein